MIESSRLEKILEGPTLTLREYSRLRAIEKGVDPDKYEKLIECESKYKINEYGDNGYAYGILQFHRKTFDSFARQYELDIDYYNPYSQIDLSTSMIRDKYLSHWSCAYIIGWL